MPNAFVRIILEAISPVPLIKSVKKLPRFCWMLTVEALLVPSFRNEWGVYRTWQPSLEPNLISRDEKRRHRRKQKRIYFRKLQFYNRYNYFGEKYRGMPHDHENCARLKFNVGGRIFETQLRTVAAFPNTLLGDPERRLPFYDPIAQMYFFDRSRFAFEAILYFYQSGGRIRRPDEIDIGSFSDEILFYDLGEDVMHDFKNSEGIYEEDDTKVLPVNVFQRKIWLLFEYPESSPQSYIVAIMSVLSIVVSIAAFCMETMPVFQPSHPNDGRNRTHEEISTEDLLDETDMTDIFNLIETICVSWFGMEFLSRLLSSPYKLKFMTDMMNIVDFIAIAPYFVQLGTSTLDDSKVNENLNRATYLSVIKIIRLVRVFRILKLSRHSTGLQILGLTLKASFRELSLLIFFLMIGVVLFSSAVYFAEVGPNSMFPSIPTSFYWGVVTMTTVGYGDMIPRTTFGKLIGTMTAVAGVLTIALPVPVIVSNFNFFYHRATSRDTTQEVANNDHVQMCPYLPGDGIHPEVVKRIRRRKHRDKFGLSSEIAVDENSFSEDMLLIQSYAGGDVRGEERQRSSKSKKRKTVVFKNRDSDSDSDSSFEALKFENRKPKQENKEKRLPKPENQEKVLPKPQNTSPEIMP